jgi:hypothetical protein
MTAESYVILYLYFIGALLTHGLIWDRRILIKTYEGWSSFMTITSGNGNEVRLIAYFGVLVWPVTISVAFIISAIIEFGRWLEKKTSL